MHGSNQPNTVTVNILLELSHASLKLTSTTLKTKRHFYVRTSTDFGGMYVKTPREFVYFSNQLEDRKSIQRSESCRIFKTMS